MRDVKALGGLLLGFVPWLLFLLLAGNSLSRLTLAIFVCLSASILLGFKGLQKGYILTWGTLLFFSACAIAIPVFHLTWVATHMDLLANGTLAGIMWATILLDQPFALEYAKEDVPKEQWRDLDFVHGCRLISQVWAWLMTFSVAFALLKRMPQLVLPAWLPSHATVFTLPLGLIFTVLYKRHRRLQRQRAKA